MIMFLPLSVITSFRFWPVRRRPACRVSWTLALQRWRRVKPMLSWTMPRIFWINILPPLKGEHHRIGLLTHVFQLIFNCFPRLFAFCFTDYPVLPMSHVGNKCVKASKPVATINWPKLNWFMVQSWPGVTHRAVLVAFNGPSCRWVEMQMWAGKIWVKR